MPDDVALPYGPSHSGCHGGEVMDNKAQEHEHCWHISNFQHAVPNHRDEQCCHCGINRCIRYEMKIPDGHGSFCTDLIVGKQIDLEQIKVPDSWSKHGVAM